MNKLNLEEMANNGELLKTGAKPKLPIKFTGVNEENLFVYKLPLSYLYYNNENGRIASAISRFENLPEPAYDNENPDYNDQIEQMIVEDNSTSLNKTKASIKRSGQKVFGYVLSDGRVIDGNRRYTALRQLNKETGTTYYFEAVVLPLTYDSKANRTEIKKLELAIQMGTEERESYDPVDLSVDIYHTIIVDKLISEQDYYRESNISIRKIRKSIMAVDLMHDFLTFINAKKNAYHIIKDSKIYNPIEELADKLNKLYPNKGPKYEDSKISSFAILTRMLVTGGDLVREYREFFKDVLSTSALSEFIERIEEPINILRDQFEENEIKTATDLRSVIEKSSDSLSDINRSYIQIKSKQSRGKNVENFLNQLKTTRDLFDEIKEENGLVGNLKYSNFSLDQLHELRNLMIKINLTTKELIEIYEDEL